MKKNSVKFLFVILCLSIAILACGLLPAANPDTSEAPDPLGASSNEGTIDEADTSTNSTIEEANPSEPTNDESASAPKSGESSNTAEEMDVGPDTLDLDNPDLFNHPNIEYYRESLLYTFTGLQDGTPITGTVKGLGAYSLNPLASTLEFYAEGYALLGAGTVYTFTQIENTSYYYTPGTGCMNFYNEETNNPYEIMLDTGGILGGTAQRVRPDEVINGIDTYQFKIDATTMDYSNPTTYDMKEIHDGRIYIAKEGGYVVRVWIEGIGQSEVLSGSDVLDGDIYYELNFFDFGIPLEIEPPAMCSTSEEATFEYPVMDDAYETASIPGLTSYKTQYSFNEVVNFYRTAMEAAGWTITQEFVSAPGAIFMFTKESSNVQVSISDEGSSVAIGIIEMNQ